MNDELEKDYWGWYKLKKKLHTSDKSKTFFHEREIWFCSLGLNIGHEQDGKHNKYERPVLILKKFNNYMLWAIPLTSGNKKGKYFFRFKYSQNGKVNSAILSQIRLFDCRRLLRRIGQIPKNDFCKLKLKFKKLL